MRKNIIITGFMGSGKSIVAEELARKLGMEFIDMDQIIEERQEMSISDVFAIKGEKYFREQENKLVKELSQDKNMVIATGGGTFLFPDNVRILSRAGEIVRLDPPEDAFRHVETLEVVREEPKGVPLETAKVVVAGGAGVGDAEVVLDCPDQR